MFEREENPQGVTHAKIVVGLASYMEADNIDYPARQVDKGLLKHYPNEAAVIINADNASPDGTEGVFMGAETTTPKIYITTPENTPGKGYNFLNMFRKVKELDADMLICIDSDLEEVDPDWIRYFAEPIEDGYDFVHPLYSRHKYDGTITNNICYPLIYGLFGKNIRQPIGGDFALSRRMMEYLLLRPWHRTTHQYGVDIFLTMNALVGGFNTCATGLGAKVHKPSAPKLGPMFIQVVSTAFLTICQNVDKWKDITEVQEEKRYGLRQLAAPQDLSIDLAQIEGQAREGFKAHQEALEQSLSAELYGRMVSAFGNDKLAIETDDWIDAVWDLIVAFRAASDKNAVVESLRGLYFGRALTLMHRTWEMTTEEAEVEFLSQARRFHARRGDLIAKLEA